MKTIELFPCTRNYNNFPLEFTINNPIIGTICGTELRKIVPVGTATGAWDLEAGGSSRRQDEGGNYVL